MERNSTNIASAAAQVAAEKYKYNRGKIAKAAHQYAKLSTEPLWRNRLGAGFRQAWAEAKQAKAAFLVKQTLVQPVVLQLTHKPVRQGSESKKYWCVELLDYTTLDLNRSNFVSYNQTEGTSCKHSYIHKLAEIKQNKVYLICRNGNRDYVINRAGVVEFIDLTTALAYAATLSPAAPVAPKPVVYKTGLQRLLESIAAEEEALLMN